MARFGKISSSSEKLNIVPMALVFLALTISQSNCRIIRSANTICQDKDPVLQTMSMTPTNYNHLQEIRRIPHRDGSTDVFYAQRLTSTCPDQVEQGITSHLHQRSTCPWDHVITVNEMRLPREIIMVRCLECRYCLDGTQNGENGCEPITREMSVLKRGECTAEGVYDWRSETIKVTVGCTCAAKATFTQG